MKKAFCVICVAMLLFGCEKKESPVSPASSQALTAGMGDAYETMLYFDVNSGLFVSQMPHIGYDLQFSSAPEERTIFLNSSNFMFVRNFGALPFESVNDTSLAQDWRYDYPTGNKNRTAIGNWYNTDGSSKNEVFVIDRGYNAQGNRLGFVKMMVLEADDNMFKIRVAELDNSNDNTATILKNGDTELTQFYFKTMAVEVVEPNKNDWHFQFTQYTDFDITEEGDTIPYLVRGVLTNQKTAEIARLDGVDFSSITKADAQILTFSNARNAIGFNWKAFSLQTGIYEVLPGIVYIVKEVSGNYYKLQFVDFYNDAGDKGYAKFKIEGL